MHRNNSSFTWSRRRIEHQLIDRLATAISSIYSFSYRSRTQISSTTSWRSGVRGPSQKGWLIPSFIFRVRALCGLDDVTHCRTNMYGPNPRGRAGYPRVFKARISAKRKRTWCATATAPTDHEEDWTSGRSTLKSSFNSLKIGECRGSFLTGKRLTKRLCPIRRIKDTFCNLRLMLT